MEANYLNLITELEKDLKLNSLLGELPNLSDFNILDFEQELEELNASCDTTLSAIEGMELELEDFDLEAMLGQLENNSQVVEEKELKQLVVDYECRVCNLQFTTTSNLQRHTRSQKHQRRVVRQTEVVQTSPFTFEVKLVTPEQPQQQLTLDQMTGIDFIEEELLFEEVDDRQSKKRKLKSRKAQKLTSSEGKKLFRCDYCPKVFTTASNLNRHENLHGNKKTHECQTCGKKFQQKEYLKKHQIVHERSTRL